MAVGVARGAPDDLRRLPAILDTLRGGRKLLLRTYLPFAGEESVPAAMSMLQLCAVSGAPWDVVLSFRIDSDDLTGWLRFIRRVVTQFGKSLDTLQITGEPNSSRHSIFMTLAIRRARTCGGRCATESSPRNLPPATAPRRSRSVSTQCQPSTRPMISGSRSPALARHLSNRSIMSAWISTPMSSVGASRRRNSPRRLNRSSGNSETATSPPEESRRAFPCASARTAGPRGPVVLMTDPARAGRSIITRFTLGLRTELNITHYELFGLRDADSSNDVSFYQFGIMRDDYTPKPAYETYQRLIRELSDPAASL